MKNHLSPSSRRAFASLKKLSLVGLGLLLAGVALAGSRPCDADLDDCLTQMSRELGNKKGWVGIELDREDDGTLTITRVISGSPAEAAGLAAGDRILALNGVAYVGGDRAALKKAYQSMKPEQTITYTIDRGGKELEIDILLARLPDRIKAQWTAKHLVEGHAQEHP